MTQELFLKIVVSAASGLFSLSLMATLLFRRIDRIMPFFLAYVGFDIISEFLASATMRYLPQDYSAVWLALCILDLGLYLCCLAEVARNLLRANRAPQVNWLVMPAILFAAAALTLWPILSWPQLPPRISLLLAIDLRLIQARTILTVAAVLALLAWSNAHKFRWPERETRVITGIGIWVLVSLAVLVVYTRGAIGRQYYWLDLLTPLACIGVDFYWIHYFWLNPRAGARDESDAVLLAAGAPGQSGHDPADSSVLRSYS